MSSQSSQLNDFMTLGQLGNHYFDLSLTFSRRRSLFYCF